MGAITNILGIITGFEHVDWGWLGWILNFINNGTGNAAWTIITFTLLLKLVTFPLDFYSRYKMKKNAVIMEELQPQLEKVEKQCKGNKQLYQQRIQPMLKKEGYSVGGACLPTLLTLVLFIFVFRGLNSYAAYANLQTFKKMSTAYDIQYAAITAPPQIDGEDNPDFQADKYLNPEDYSTTLEYYDAIQESIDPILLATYKESNPSWLWIVNPWRPDIPYFTGFFNFMANVKPIPDYKEFVTGSYSVSKVVFKVDGDTQEAKDAYNKIMGAVISEYNSAGNGYYILAVVAVAVSFFSQRIMQKSQASQQQQQMQMGAGMNKFMMILFPVMMGIFAFSSTSVFTLYIITNSTTSLLATLAINKIVEMRMQKLKAQREAQIGYRRR